MSTECARAARWRVASTVSGRSPFAARVALTAFSKELSGGLSEIPAPAPETAANAKTIAAKAVRRCLLRIRTGEQSARFVGRQASPERVTRTFRNLYIPAPCGQIRTSSGIFAKRRADRRRASRD